MPACCFKNILCSFFLAVQVDFISIHLFLDGIKISTKCLCFLLFKQLFKGNEYSYIMSFIKLTSMILNTKYITTILSKPSTYYGGGGGGGGGGRFILRIVILMGSCYLVQKD